jgi:hypothetical protein
VNQIGFCSFIFNLISGNWKHIYEIFQYLLTMFEFVKPDKSCLMSSSIFSEETGLKIHSRCYVLGSSLLH